MCAMDTEMLSTRNVQEGIYWWDVPHMTLKFVCVRTMGASQEVINFEGYGVYTNRICVTYT